MQRPRLPTAAEIGFAGTLTVMGSIGPPRSSWHTVGIVEQIAAGSTNMLLSRL